MTGNLLTLKRLIDERQVRARAGLPPSLLGEPAWDMMLDLALARALGRRISVTSACIASGVPATTALRYIEQMQDRGVIRREPDPHDRRRWYLSLSDAAYDAMNRYLSTIAPLAA